MPRSWQLKAYSHHFYFLLNALVTVLATSASIICVSTSHFTPVSLYLGKTGKVTVQWKLCCFRGTIVRNKKGADRIQMYLCNCVLRGLQKRSSWLVTVLWSCRVYEATTWQRATSQVQLGMLSGKPWVISCFESHLWQDVGAPWNAVIFVWL